MANMINTIELDNEFNKINSFKYNDSGRFIFFDVFVKNKELYVIMPVYRSHFPNIDNLNISSLDFTFTIKHKKCKIDCEAIIVLIYEITPIRNNILDYEYVNLTAKYEHLENTYKLINYTSQPNKHYLTLTTLFKDDYNLGQLFCNYYQKQGIEYFYLYYNGIPTDEIVELFNRTNITLIPWNFRYFNYWENSYWTPDDEKFMHHAQTGQIHHALYKYGKDNSKYMIFCDFDEYMYIPQNTLKTEIQNTTADAYSFFCYWSKTLDNYIPSEFPEQILIGEKIPEGRRKHIYNTNSVNLIGIHEPNTFLIDNPTQLARDYMLLHFIKWTKPYREIDLYTILDIPKI